MAADDLQTPSSNNSHESNVKVTVESVLGGKTKLRKVKKTEDELRMENFCVIVASLEYLNTREHILSTEFSLNLEKYNDSFYEVIDNLLKYSFNKNQIEFINWYIEDRIDDEGNLVGLQTPDGKVFYLENPAQLYNYIKNIK